MFVIMMRATLAFKTVAGEATRPTSQAQRSVTAGEIELRVFLG